MAPLGLAWGGLTRSVIVAIASTHLHSKSSSRVVLNCPSYGSHAFEGRYSCDRVLLAPYCRFGIIC